MEASGISFELTSVSIEPLPARSEAIENIQKCVGGFYVFYT